MASRIETVFANAKADGRGTLGVFVTAGDPDAETCTALLDTLVESGADFIELGMPFSDPMADGPAIQASSLRALKAGMSLAGTLQLARDFRQRHPAVPLILMGYYNPIYIYGNDRFIADAVAAGVDGLILVDLPPEEDAELCLPAKQAGLDFIRLITPTSDDIRLPAILAEASGFVYYVSVTGITGTASAAADSIAAAMTRIRKQTDLPIVTGFGIRTAAQAAEAARLSNGAVVGSAVVNIIADNLPDGTTTISADNRQEIIRKIAAFVADLSAAIRG
ncbi:MAG: tryptophan synthase subunit alpha [Candidatus Puniceispirillum sp.]|jgi:tryptophan synthase alpha chain